MPAALLHSFTIDCRKCDGTGNDGVERCHDCNGARQVEAVRLKHALFRLSDVEKTRTEMLSVLKTIDELIQECDACNGTGNNPNQINGDCYVCGGHGKDYVGDVLDVIPLVREAIKNAEAAA